MTVFLHFELSDKELEFLQLHKTDGKLKRYTDTYVRPKVLHSLVAKGLIIEYVSSWGMQEESYKFSVLGKKYQKM